MTQAYKEIMVAVDGSPAAELALKKAIHIAGHNKARLTICHVIDTRSLQSVATYDSDIYDQLTEEANTFMNRYEEEARRAGLDRVVKVIEYGNPKTLLATTIPTDHAIDLILVGATGLNAFERLLVGSSSEYILRHAKVDILVVREGDKVL